MRLPIITAIAVGLMALAISPAFAQDVYPQIDGHVRFEWGNLLADMITQQAGPLAIAAVGLIMNFLPGPVRSMVRMTRVDQLLERAVVSAINKTAGAVQGKSLSAAVGNEVIEKALDYAAYNAPKMFKSLPINEWREKIIARLNFAENVAIDTQSQGFVQVPR